MKYIKKLSLLTTLIFTSCAFGQKGIHINAVPDSWTAFNCYVVYKANTINLKKENKEDGLLWLNNTSFKNGTIELDIKGKDERGNSFVGVAFHGADDTNFDAIYFRPFNFKSIEKHSHSVQYINKPNEPWHVLRKEFPKKYENSVSPVPNPNDWFHAKIEINYPHVKVYVNESEFASLEVEQRSSRTQGKIGLWLDSDEGWFKNIVVTHIN